MTLHEKISLLCKFDKLYVSVTAIGVKYAYINKNIFHNISINFCYFDLNTKFGAEFDMHSIVHNTNPATSDC